MKGKTQGLPLPFESPWRVIHSTIERNQFWSFLIKIHDSETNPHFFHLWAYHQLIAFVLFDDHLLLSFLLKSYQGPLLGLTSRFSKPHSDWCSLCYTTARGWGCLGRSHRGRHTRSSHSRACMASEGMVSQSHNPIRNQDAKQEMEGISKVEAG